jgi:hypothetical protein
MNTTVRRATTYLENHDILKSQAGRLKNTATNHHFGKLRTFESKKGAVDN